NALAGARRLVEQGLRAHGDHEARGARPDAARADLSEAAPGAIGFPARPRSRSRETRRRSVSMTGQADFTAEEWKEVLDGPPSAALVVALAQRGGSFRESFSIAKSYTEARQAHGDSQLLDEIVSVKPHIDHTRH